MPGCAANHWLKYNRVVIYGVLDTLHDAYPLLVRDRVLAAVAAAVRRHGGPCTSSEARAETEPLPITRSAKAFAALARKVAGLEPDELGRRLVRAGTDPDGVALWTIDGATLAEPAPCDHAAQLERIAEHVTRLGLALPGEPPLAALERLLEAQPTPAELAPAAPRIDPPSTVQAAPAAQPSGEPEQSREIPTAVVAAAPPAVRDVARTEPPPVLTLDELFASMRAASPDAAEPLHLKADPW